MEKTRRIKKTWLIARLASCEWNVQDGEEFKRGLYEKMLFWKTAFSPTSYRKISETQNFWTKNCPRLISVYQRFMGFKVVPALVVPSPLPLYACLLWLNVHRILLHTLGVFGSFLIRSFHRCLGRPISHIFCLVFSEKFWQLFIDPPLSKHARLDLSFGVSMWLISYLVR